MKEKIIALVVLVFIVGAIATNAVVLDKNISELADGVSSLSLSDDNAQKNAEELYSRFKEKETYISITVNHEDLTSIEEAFSDMIGYLSVGNTDDAEVTKHRLIDSLEHLRRACGLNIDAII